MVGSITLCKGKRQHTLLMKSELNCLRVCCSFFPGRLINSVLARCFDLVSSCLGLRLPGVALKPNVFTQILQPKLYFLFPRYSLLMSPYTVQRQINKRGEKSEQERVRPEEYKSRALIRVQRLPYSNDKRHTYSKHEVIELE